MVSSIQMVVLLTNLMKTIALLPSQNQCQILEEVQVQLLLKKKPVIPNLRKTDKFVVDKKTIRENEIML